MSFYVYEKYNAIWIDESYSESDWSYGGIGNETTMSGYPGYSFVAGSFSTTGSSVEHDVYDCPITIYTGGGSSITRYDLKAADTSVDYTYYTKTAIHHDGYYAQWDYIGEVVAEGGTYPDNGESDGYWYVKNRAATIPTISVSANPSSGDNEQSYTLTVTASKGDFTEDSPKFRYMCYISSWNTIGVDTNDTTKIIVPISDLGVAAAATIQFKMQYFTSYGTVESETISLVVTAALGLCLFMHNF